MSFLRTRLPQKTQHLPQKQLLQVPARCSALPPGLWRERRLLTGEREPTCAAPEPAGTFRNPPQGAAGSLRLLQRGEVVCPSSPTEHPGRGLARSWRLPAEPALGQQQGAECSVRRLPRAGTAREAEHQSFNQKVQRTWGESMKNNFDTLKQNSIVPLSCIFNKKITITAFQISIL